MQIGQLNLLSSLAATRMALSGSAETERTQHETSAHDLVVESALEAEAAEGIGTTHEEQAAGDRDGDGRRPWEFAPSDPDDDAPNRSATPTEEHHSKDPTGERGSQFDLSG
jgi:hypothetical protein